MKRIFLMLALVFACCCSHTNAFYSPSFMGGDQGDDDARDTQLLMASTVEVDLYLTLQFPALPTEKGVPDPDSRSTSGSGVVVSRDPFSGTMRVLTAGHICQYIEGPFVNERGRGSLIESRITVQSFDGSAFPARVLRYSSLPDLCLLEVKGDVPWVVTLSDGLPPVGSFIVTAGAPFGMMDKWVVYAADGRMLGQTLDQSSGCRYIATSIPVAPGSSGSGVFYHGQLVGIVRSVNQYFPHLSYAVAVQDVRRFLGGG